MDVIVHFDEIFLKGKNQPAFIRRLCSNLNALFPGVAVRRVEGGFLLSNFQEKDLPRLALIPGVAKLAACKIVASEIEAIEKAALEFAPDWPVKTFRLTASRSNKKFSLTSEELNRRLGRVVQEKRGWKVDLKNPDFNLFVDVGKDKTLFYHEPKEGIGGLPTGSAGKVLCLLSGGIDSPVAAYLLMKRGAEISLVHFQNQTEVTDDVSEKIIDLAKILARYQPKVKLFIVPFAECQKQIVMKIPADQRMLSSRRLFLRYAAELAEKEKCLALAVGDSLGQVASQTLENLAVVYEAAPGLKLAPLVGWNKSETMKLARRIGTLEISNRPYEDCCSLFVAKHPETKAELKKLKTLEKTLVPPPLDKLGVISYNISMN